MVPGVHVDWIRRVRISVGLGVALFAAGGLFGWWVERPFPDWESRIPLHVGFEDLGALIWLAVLPAAVVVIAPMRSQWPLVLWPACVPLVGLVVSAWVAGRDVVVYADAFSAGLVVSSVGAFAVLLALSMAVALRD